MSLTARKLEALRNLAERPGTEHEGEVARAMLEKLTGQRYRPPIIREQFDPKRAARKKAPAPKQPDYMTDPLKMAQEVRKRFPVGTRVYYTGPGFPYNSPGTVVGYESAGFRVIVDFEWDDTEVMLTACCPIGWCLTKKPMSKETARKFYAKGPNRPVRPEVKSDYTDARKRYDDMMGKF